MSSLLCCLPRDTPEVDFEVRCTNTCCVKQVVERRRSIKQAEIIQRDEVDGRKKRDDDAAAAAEEELPLCCCCYAKKVPPRNKT